jgi:hypothetical protein
MVVLPLVLLIATAAAADPTVSGPAPSGGATPQGVPPPPSLLAPFQNPVKPQVQDEYQLQRAKDGSRDLVYDSTTFTARVARDGSVVFRDKRFGISVLPLFFRPRTTRPPVTGVPSLWSFLHDGGRPNRIPPELAEDATTSYGSRLPIPTMTPFRPDPREACRYPRPCFFDAAVTIVNVSVTFDVTDELMRFAGQDPYRYAKAKFLAATRELRAGLAARAHADDIRAATSELPERLQTIRCDERMSVADRRAILRGLRAELDTAASEGRAAAARIDVALADLDRPDGAASCPPR